MNIVKENYMKFKYFIKFLLVFLFLIVVINANAATYYLTSAGASSAQTASNWNTVAGGGGTAATTFVNNGDIFIIPVGISGVASGNWTFGSNGGGSVQLSVLGSLTVNSGVTVTLEQKNAGITTVTVGNGGTIFFAGTSSNQLIGSTNGNGTVADLIFNLNAGASLRTNNASGVLGTTASISNTLLTTNLTAGANYEFSGASQAMGFSLTSVNHLTLSGSGTKTWLAGLTTITGNFTSSGTITTTVPAGLSVTGNFTVGSGTTFNAGAFTHSISGNWSNAGTFNSTGTVSFPGATAQSITGGGFNHVTFSGAGTKSLLGTIPVAGNWTNNGTISAGTSSVTLTGTSAQSVGGTSSTAFYNLTFNGSGLKTLTNASSVTNTLTLTSGIMEIVNVDFLVNAFSGGSASSYIRTNGTGRVKQPILLNATKTFPIGNSAYNPAEITNDQESPSGIFRIRVADVAIENANVNAKTVNRRWYLTLEAAGDVNITAKFTYNTGETGVSFDRTVNPKMGFFNGEWWEYGAATVTGSGPYTFTSSGTLHDNIAYPDQFIALGSDDAFSASKLSVSVFPANPTLGAGNSIITVRSLNSQNVMTCVMTPTVFDVTATNTTFTATSTSGTIQTNTYEAEITNVTFKTATIDNTTATLTATSTSGESLTTSTSAAFQVISGAIYEPVATGSWSTVTWRKSIDGGTTWTSPATLPVSNVFGETDLIQIPAGITLTSDVTASFYSMIVLGTLDLNSGTLTLNHPLNNDGGYDVHVHGLFKNSGGTFVNNDGTSGTTYPIEMHGGEYWHARDGGSIPIATWESLSGTPTTCRVTGIVNTALTAGLNQSFQNFIWNNASQAVVQNLHGDLNVSGDLTLTNGIISTGSNYFIQAAVGSISRTNGWINGNFRLYIPNTTNASVSFPIGDTSNYAPVSVTFSGTTSGSGYINAYTTTGVPPYASGLSQTKYINRKWVITSNGVNFSTYSISLNYNDADKVGGPTDFVLRRLSNGTWFNTGGTSTSNTITASGQNTFSEFYIGETDCDTQLFWFGGVSTDWNNGSNWCSGTAPISTSNVVVPGGIAVYPVLTATGNCNHLTLQSGATLETGSNTLNVYGNLDNSGTISSSSGTVNFIGSSAQTITGTGGSTSFHHLTVNNTGGLSSSSHITVNGTLTLTNANTSATVGALHMQSGFKLIMGENSTNAGTGDVSGIIRREHTFTPLSVYTFGHLNTNMYFDGAGTRPAWLEATVEIGVTTDSANSVKRKYFFKVDATGYTDLVNVKLHYLDSELNGNDENSLVFYDDHGVVSHEHGFSNRDNTNNWVSYNEVGISYIATTAGTKYWFLDHQSSTRNNWIGVSTSWNSSNNWSLGHYPGDSGFLTDDVYLPAGKNNYPVLSTDIELKSIEIASGANVNAVSFTLTVTGATNAWLNNGVFTAGTGTVFFNHNTLNDTVDVKGSTIFNHLTVGSTTYLQPQTNAFIYLTGALTVNSGAKMDFRTYVNTLQFNTTSDYTVQNLTDGTKTGYHHLIFNHTAGTISLPAGNLNVKGNFHVDGLINHNSGTLVMDGVVSQNLEGQQAYDLNHLTIDNAAGVQVIADDSINVLGSLTINSGKILQVHAGKKVNATTVVNNAGVSGLILKAASGQPNASFKFSNAVENPVAATVEMYSKAFAATLDTLSGVYSNHQWQYIGVPVSDFAKSNPLLSGTYMRQFTESSSLGWGVVGSVLEGFRGYSITQPVGKTITWQGNLFNQDKTLNLTFTSTNPFEGANFVANSFTSAVIIKDIVFGAGVDANVFLFNTGKVEHGSVVINEESENTTPGQYINIPRLNAGAGGLPTTISSMQGFFVQSNSSTNNHITIPYSATKSNVAPMRAPMQHTPNDFTLVMTVKGERYTDKIWIFGNPTCSNQFDNGWDGKKMFGLPAAPQLYVKSEQEVLQVQTTNTIDQTRIGINKGEDSVYTFILKVEKKEVYFPDGMYLIDTKTDESVEVFDNITEYSFTLSEGEDASERFVLSKTPNLNTDITTSTHNNQVKITGVEDKINIQNKSDHDLQIFVSDLTGKVVMQSFVSAQTDVRLVSALPTGLYTVSARGNQFNQNQLIRLIAL